MVDVSILPEKSATSLGLRLAALREGRGISLEQAAHETRMMIQRLREMEADDLSHFVHPSYARMFLTDYARYLGLPLEEIRHLLPAQGACGGEGYQYLQEEGPLAIQRARPTRRSRTTSRAMKMSALGALGALVIFGGIEAVVVLRKIDRLGLSKVAQESDRAVITAPPVAATAPVPVSEPQAETAPIFPVENSMTAQPSGDPNAPDAKAAENSDDVITASSAPATATAPAASSAPVSFFVGSSVDHGNAVQ